MPAPEKPRDLEEYKAWAAREHRIEYDDTVRQIFETNAKDALSQVQKHAFFLRLQELVERLGTVFASEKGVKLLVDRGYDRFNLTTKPYASMLDKSYRHNVSWNPKWPKAPEGSWITPDNWLERFDDIVRGTIVCKYFDAPAALCAGLEKDAAAIGLEARSESRQLDEGYYAYHFYVAIPVKILNKDWKKRSIKLEVEVQATTHLQEAVRELTGPFYRETRSLLSRDRSKWKWDHQSARFKAGYISHTLHLIEALIVELRSVTPPPAPARTEDEHDGEASTP